MKRLIFLALVMAALGFLAIPIAAQAQLAEVNEAVAMLTGPAMNGGRTNVDMAKRYGADVTVTKAAAAKLQTALGSASGDAARLLKEAVAFGNAGMHKEMRLRAQGAQYYLCQGGSDEACAKVPKAGTYFP